jgi:hypothetical protein
MVNWLIIGIGILAVIVVTKVIHFRHLKHRITALFLILLLLFAYLSFSSIVRSNSIDLKTVSGVLTAGKLYFSWLGATFINIKTLTGNAINMDWGPNNESISDMISKK